MDASTRRAIYASLDILNYMSFLLVILVMCLLLAGFTLIYIEEIVSFLGL